MSIAQEYVTKKLKLPLDDVCYMIRNVVVGDEEESRIDSVHYLSQMTLGYKQIVEHLILKGRYRSAAEAYIHYFLCIKGNLQLVKERIPTWAWEFEWEDKDSARKLQVEMIQYVETELS